jgi:hypothetical protein
MGRRSTKSSPATGAALPFDTVGMTILPGRSMPVWAEPAAEASRLPAPELIADAPEPAVAAFAGAQVPAQEWASAAESGRAPVDQAATSMEPAFAMAGATQVGAPPAAEPAVYGNPSHAYPQEPARYPAAPAAGLATTATPSTHVDQNTPMTAPVPEAPSTEWKSPARPELSPEHVALLSWWADMIAAGQFPAPPGTLTTEVTAPAKQPRRAFPVKAAALGRRRTRSRSRHGHLSAGSRGWPGGDHGSRDRHPTRAPPGLRPAARWRDRDWRLRDHGREPPRIGRDGHDHGRARRGRGPDRHLG